MPELILKHSASVGTPSNGAVSIYAKSDNSVYVKDANGNESTIMYEGAGKNRIINGDMRINQRVPGALNVATATTDGGYTVDRFSTSRGGAYLGTLTWTWDSTDVPTNAQAGRTFKRSLKLTTTQDTTPGTDGYVLLRQKIEGYNIVDIISDGYNNGFTLSFWIKNSNIGTYCVSIMDSAQSRAYLAEYTINAANTWEKKTIVVTAAPSGGTWDTTNGIGLLLGWTFVSGTDYDDGVNGTWVSTGEFSTSNQKNWADVASNVWITGVQLEAGTRATNYEFRSFQQELALCQRYHQKSMDQGTAEAHGVSGGMSGIIAYKVTGVVMYVSVPFPVAMRSTPTISFWGYANEATNPAWRDINNTVSLATNADSFNAGQSGFTARHNATTGTAGHYYIHYSADAEL